MADLIERIKVRAEDQSTRTDHTEFSVPTIERKLIREEMEHFESIAGVKLPEFLKLLYMEIGNGGFGPGYGLHELIKTNDNAEDSSLDIYLIFSKDDQYDKIWSWPDSFVPVIDWGCAIRSCLDCDTGELYIFDPNVEPENMIEYFIPQAKSVEEAFEKWCDGVDLWKEIYG